VRSVNRAVGALSGLLIGSLAVNAALHFLASPGTETVWIHIGQLLRGIQGADSWKPMEVARAYTDAHDSGLYDEVFFRQGVKFQYPPAALLFFGQLHRPALNVLSWIATVLTAVLAAAILRRSLQRAWPAEGWPHVAWRLDVLTVLAALSFYPLVKAYSLGQIQSWLNLLFAGAIFLWMTGARGAAGGAVAIMSLIKPPYALLFVWASLRGEWTFVRTGAAVVSAGLALSVWQYGLSDHLAYARVLSFIGSHGEAFYPNQSFNGVLNRLLFNGSNLEWRYHEFAPVHPVVVAGTTAAFIALVALALWPPDRDESGGVVDMSVVALAVTMSAPVSWEHHYGILVPIYAATAPVILARRPLGRWTWPALAASYFVAANYFQLTDRFAATWMNPLQSYLLAAALLLWLLLYRTEHGARALPAQ
jgi:hypothetical protein